MHVAELLLLGSRRRLHEVVVHGERLRHHRFSLERVVGSYLGSFVTSWIEREIDSKFKVLPVTEGGSLASGWARDGEGRRGGLYREVPRFGPLAGGCGIWFL